MKKEELLKQYQMIPERMIKYGFCVENNCYVLIKKLNQELYAKIKVQKKVLEVNVYEQDTNEVYLPFYMKKATGTYVSELKEKVENCIKDIILNCFEKVDIRTHILTYVKEKYGTVPEYSWEDNPNFFTLKTKKKQKWYGLVMDIPSNKLGLKTAELVDVINLKNDPEKIKTLIDYQNFFPAYHMNKKYWFSILLNNQIDFEKLIQLIDESYQSVEM